MIFDDRADNYNLDLDLDEPVSRAAALAAAAAGWKLERLALDCGVSVDEARLRCAEERVRLTTLWTRKNQRRAALWKALAMWKAKGCSASAAAKRYGVSREAVQRTLAQLGYTLPVGGVQAPPTVQARTWRQKAQTDLAKRIAEKLAEGMTREAAARACGVSRNTGLAALTVAGLVPQQGAPLKEALIDVLERERAKPPLERMMFKEIAAEVGCAPGFVAATCHHMGWRWREERQEAQHEHIREVAAAHPGASKREIGRLAGVSDETVRRALK